MSVPVPRWLKSGRVPDGKLRSGLRILLIVMCEEADKTGWVSRSAEWLAHQTGQCRGNFYKQIRRLKAQNLLESETRAVFGRRIKGWRLTLDGVRVTPQEGRIDAEILELRERVKQLELTLAEREDGRTLRVVREPAAEPAPIRDQAEALLRGIEDAVVTCVEVDGHAVFGAPEDLAPLVHAGAQLHEMPLWPPSRPLRRGAALTMIRENGILVDRSVATVLLTLWWYRVDLEENPAQLDWWNENIFKGPYKTAEPRAQKVRARHEARLAALLGRPVGGPRFQAGREVSDLSRGTVHSQTHERGTGLDNRTGRSGANSAAPSSPKQRGERTPEHEQIAAVALLAEAWGLSPTPRPGHSDSALRTSELSKETVRCAAPDLPTASSDLSVETAASEPSRIEIGPQTPALRR